MHNARFGERHEFPGPGAFPIITLKRRDAHRRRPRPSRRPKLHVDLIEPAFLCRGGQGGDDAADQSGEIFSRPQRLSPIGDGVLACVKDER